MHLINTQCSGYNQAKVFKTILFYWSKNQDHHLRSIVNSMTNIHYISDTNKQLSSSSCHSPYYRRNIVLLKRQLDSHFSNIHQTFHAYIRSTFLNDNHENTFWDEKWTTTYSQRDENLFLSTQEKKQEEFQEELIKFEDRRSTIRRAVTSRERKIRDWKGNIPRECDVQSKTVEGNYVRANKTLASTVIGEVNPIDPSVINIQQFYAPALTGLTDYEKAWFFWHLKMKKGYPWSSLTSFLGTKRR